MRAAIIFFHILFLFAFSLHSQEETKTFLLSKAEYKKFEGAESLIAQSIKNAFGEANKQNPYKIDIKQVDAWNASTPEFKYYPAVPKDTKKALLNTSVINSKENIAVNLRVTINPGSTELNASIKSYVSKKHTFNLNIIVLGDERIMIKETKNKTDFFSLIDEKAFADKAFKTFFGDQKKMNYSIAYDKLTACFVKNMLEPKCVEKFELLSSPDNVYTDFNNKITSAEYSSAYVIFDILVSRTRSKFNEDVEKLLIKKKDSTEHLKFCFVIPKDNLRAKQKKIMDIEGEILNKDKKPQKGLTVYLRNNGNTVIGTQITNEKGTFKFSKLKEDGNYNLFIDATGSSEKTLFLSTNNEKITAQFEKIESGFEYKLLPADIVILSSVEESDPSIEYTSTLKGKMVKVTDKIAPLSNQKIELKNNSNQVIQSQQTDGKGNFEFIALNRNINYSIEMPNYVPAKNEKVYLANSKNELIKQFKKDENNKLVFKIIPADICLLTSINEEDVELTFNKQKTFNQTEIIIQDFIYYATNSFQITAESKTTLDKIAKIAAENPVYKLEIISHTDSRGEDTENQKLSEKRSESVMAYLVAKDIDPKRLKPVGMGESKPLNSCSEAASCIEDEYKMNRRTEFKFYK